PLEADLSPWAGKRVRIKLIADVGPADNSSGDWAAWSELRLESLHPTLVTTLHETPVALQRVPGPYPLDRLTTADLRRARNAMLHFEGIGLQNGGQYVSHASLNGVPLGALPQAGGDEEKGVWAEASVPIPEKAIATLGRWNQISIENPGQDCFKVRRFWIELELGDGRRASSDVTRPAVTQPPEWKHAEGQGVPFGKPIELQVRFQAE
ncbi:MAG: hypothetical protein NUV77_16475, partial [Thermoguttaceae bacterium]|nr:hypothetical protein [Thermoguttaceae bacterium]